MLLTIDIGNSNLFAVLMDETGKHIKESRIETERINVAEYYSAWITQFKEGNVINDFILSCVVPSITQEVFLVLQETLQVKGILLNMDIMDGFEVLLDNPKELGADFIATSIGAINKYQKPLLVVDMGTANKISVINEAGQFVGGIIAAGMGIEKKAMEDMIPHLPKIELEIPEQLVGSNTIACMQSGIVNGNIYSIQGICQQIEKEYGLDFTKILTGGYGNVIYRKMENFAFDSYLLNDGLWYIYQNIKNKDMELPSTV